MPPAFATAGTSLYQVSIGLAGHLYGAQDVLTMAVVEDITAAVIRNRALHLTWNILWGYV